MASFSDGLEAIHQMVPPLLLSKEETEKRISDLAHPPMPPVAPGADAWSAEGGKTKETAVPEAAMGYRRTS